MEKLKIKNQLTKDGKGGKENDPVYDDIDPVTCDFVVVVIRLVDADAVV